MQISPSEGDNFVIKRVGRSDGSHDDGLQGQHDESLGAAGRDERNKLGAEDKMYHETVYNERHGETVCQRSEKAALEVRAGFIKEQAVDNARHGGGGGEAREIRPRGEQKRAHKVGQRSAHACPHRPVEHGAHGGGGKAEPDLCDEQIKRQQPRKNDIERNEHCDYNYLLCVFFHPVS